MQASGQRAPLHDQGASSERRTVFSSAKTGKTAPATAISPIRILRKSSRSTSNALSSASSLLMRSGRGRRTGRRSHPAFRNPRWRFLLRHLGQEDSLPQDPMQKFAGLCSQAARVDTDRDGAGSPLTAAGVQFSRAPAANRRPQFSASRDACAHHFV
jgi:hypothetical protein